MNQNQSRDQAATMGKGLLLLKRAVAGMGVLIVIGTGLLIWAVLTKGNRGAAPLAPTSVSLPPGARIVEMTAQGDRLILRLEQPAATPGGATDSLLLLDPQKGRLIGRIDLPRAPVQ